MFEIIDQLSKVRLTLIIKHGSFGVVLRSPPANKKFDSSNLTGINMFIFF